MAEIFKNEKEFLIIKMKGVETLLFGGYGICDSCNIPNLEGYYIAALNYWMCDHCFDEWYKSATRYKEDIPYEKRHFDRICEFFSINQ